MRIGEIRKNDTWKRENAAHGEFSVVNLFYIGFLDIFKMQWGILNAMYISDR